MYNASYFLAFRRFLPIKRKHNQPIASAEELLDFLQHTLNSVRGKCGLLLSGGVDSAVLAKFAPPGTIAYTIYYDRLLERIFRRNEFDAARTYVEANKNIVAHRGVLVKKSDFFNAHDLLIEKKKMPTVPHEASIFLACLKAKEDGVTHIINGMGADGRFGGLSNFYRASERSAFRRFISEAYFDPQTILNEPQPIDWVIDQFTENGVVNVQNYLTEIGTEGTAVSSTIEAAGLIPVQPFGMVKYAKTLDVSKIVSGNEKYVIHDAYKLCYPEIAPRRKRALEVPIGSWLGGYRPSRREFKQDLDLSGMHGYNNWRGKRLFLLYSVEKYFTAREKGAWECTAPTGLYER